MASLAALMDAFIRGEDQSRAVAAQIEVGLSERFGERQPYSDLPLALASYQPGGGELLFDADRIVSMMRPVFALVRAEERPLLRSEDIGPDVMLPAGLVRIVEQGLVDLSPWLILPRTEALDRMAGLRARYKRPYVPFARRQDNDLAALLPNAPDRVVIVHDFADEGWELRSEYASFWDWFRAAIEEMISFE